MKKKKRSIRKKKKMRAVRYNNDTEKEIRNKVKLSLKKNHEESDDQSLKDKLRKWID